MSVFKLFVYICPMKTSKARTKIIETAADLFYRNGYNRTGINEIIKEAGVARATLYSHFASKDDICVAYLQYMNRSLINDIEARVAPLPEGKKRVLGLFDFLWDFFRSEDFNGCWCIKTVAEVPEDNTSIMNEIHSQKDALRAYIERLVKDNIPGLTPFELQQTSNQLYLLYEGALAESYLHNDNWPIESARRLGQKLLT